MLKAFSLTAGRNCQNNESLILHMHEKTAFSTLLIGSLSAPWMEEIVSSHTICRPKSGQLPEVKRAIGKLEHLPVTKNFCDLCNNINIAVVQGRLNGFGLICDELKDIIDVVKHGSRIKTKEQTHGLVGEWSLACCITCKIT